MLYYVGNGSFLIGVPARNMTEEEAEEYGGKDSLCASGLYTTIEPDTLHIEAVKERRSKTKKEDE